MLVPVTCAVDGLPALRVAVKVTGTSITDPDAYRSTFPSNGAVIRFTSEVIEFMDAEIEKRQREIVAEHGYELVDHNLVLYVRKKK